MEPPPPSMAPGAAADDPGTRVAVDVGGTFIDFVMIDAGSGQVSVEKQPSNPASLAEEVVEGLERLPVPLTEVSWLLHGSTVALNAIVQERGAKTGLITTKGFRDVLELGRGARADIYDWLHTPPDPLVPRYLRREVAERLTVDGDEIRALDLDELDEQVDLLVADGVEAVAIAFLHAYANPAHERSAVDRIRRRHPHLRLTASSDVATEWREFERTSTAVLNAYVQPTFGGYLDDLGERLRDAGYRHDVSVMRSNGGVVAAARAASLPVSTVMSGPAGGAIGGRMLSQALEMPDLVCTDVGGTTFDVVLIEGGEILERTQTSIGDRPILAPTIDIVSIGAGGGSIAWIDDTGALQVGPRSAGAHPGPVAFGLGATEPTVTDCQLLLGRLPTAFLGGRMDLDVDGAGRAVRTHIADPLGLSLEAAALGVVTIAEINMSRAIRVLTIERGADPRTFGMLAYGGGGGLFAAGTAAELEMPRIIIPRAAANFSAWGILASDYREDASLTRVRPLGVAGVVEITRDLEELSQQVVAHLADARSPEATVSARLDLRFLGQEHTITVPFDWPSVEDPAKVAASVRERFVASHRQLYGHGDADGPIEIVTARCRGIGTVDRPRWPAWSVTEPAAPAATRPVWFDASGPADTPVYERDLLALGQTVHGPAVIEEWSTTVLVPTGCAVSTDGIGNLTMERA